MRENNSRSFYSGIKRNKYLLLMFLPCFLYFIIFKYFPMFGLVIAFKDYNVFRGIWESPWVGLKWFDYFIFQNRDFLILLRNTFLLGVYKLIFSFPAPIILALLINELRVQWFKRSVQSIGYIPHFLSTVIVVSMTVVLLSQNGFITELLQWFGFEAVGLLNKPEYFRTIYILTEIWQHVGWETILYMAALAAIDPQLYEAAHVDGAGRFHKMIHITLPGIAPTIIILLILNVGSLIEIGFEKVFLLYNPATYSTADVISTYVYRVGFLTTQYSYGSAIDFFNSIISLVLIVSANYISRKVSDTSLY